MRIAVWSGPRNLSTAMMYSFAARGDCAAWDEPFYAPFLARSGLDHPMRDAILAAHMSEPDEVAKRASGVIPDGHDHWYQKHMPHHMEGMPLDWAEGFTHVHLIRHPARVIASYVQKREEPSLDDLGFRQQLDIFERFPGPVLDSFAVRLDPKSALEALCADIGLPWNAGMLTWPAGPKPFDGVWGQHWYNAVHQSTGFAGPEGPLPELDGRAADLLARALPYYEAMKPSP